MHCKFCPSDIIRRPRKFMDFSLFKKTIDQLAMLNTSIPIMLHNLGEPLLHKNLFKFIDYAASKNIRIYLFTNGVTILENMPELCKRDNINALVLSVQTPTLETYKLRGCIKPFNSYMDDIYKAIDYFILSDSKMRIEIHLGETKGLHFRDWDILRDPKDALKIIQEMSQRISNAEGPSNYIPETLLDQREYWYPIALNGHDIYIKIKHFMTWGKFFPAKAVLEKNAESGFQTTCEVAKTDLVVLADGTISICCIDIEGEMNLGNVQNTTILDVLMSNKRTKIINDITESDLCRRCRGITNESNSEIR